jgi:hypothetical protein
MDSGKLDSTTEECSTLVEAERRLWFDFISKLNDRSLEQSNRSGATTWVLTGLVGAIMYKSVPLVSSFLSVPGDLNLAIVLLFLGFDLSLSLLVFVAGTMMYVHGPQKRRLWPERTVRAKSVKNDFVLVISLLLAVCQIYVGAKFVGSSLTKWNLVGFGVWWGINSLTGIFKRLLKSKRARQRKIKAPEFTGFELGTDWGPMVLCVFSVPFSGLASYVCFEFIQRLGHSGVNWVVPLGAAVQFATICCIVAALFFRSVDQVVKSAFLNLEQSIVVENLSPAEIRTRFVTELLGPEVGEWLQEITKGLALAGEKLLDAVNSYNQQIRDIEQISEDYSLERRGRAQKLVTQITRVGTEHKAAVDRCAFELKQYLGLVLSDEESRLLDSVVKQLDETTKHATLHKCAVHDTLAKLAKIVPEPAALEKG